jgi:TonB family protein
MIGIMLFLLFQLQIATPPPRFEDEPEMQGIVVLDATVTPERRLNNIQVLEGRPPFVQEAQQALKEWQFGNDTNPGERISITFLFRDTIVLPDMPHRVVLPRICCPGGTGPAIPEQIIDSGYPIGGLGEGSVILELRLGADGRVEGMNVPVPVPTLTEAAQRAVAQWRFSPATLNGRAVPSSSVVVIRYLRPETW